MENFFKKIRSLLQVRARASGLEVTDEVVRIAQFDGKLWRTDAVRLEPGIVAGGRIAKRPEFVAALKALKEKVGRKNKNVNVVVCLSSLSAYTQVFTLPLVKGAELEKAVDLNLRMSSPMSMDDVYSDWQVAARDDHAGKIEILASFIEKSAVDEMVDALFEAGFLVMAVESRALALTRVLREKGAGVDAKDAHVFINIDNTGMEFLIIRHGVLYFEYARPWHDLANEKGEIPTEKFQEVLAGSVRQVTNFYHQHWTDPLAGIIFSTVALEPETERMIAESATVPAARLTLVMGKPISSEWLVALGASIRGTEDSEEEVNLLGDASLDRFREEQLLHFMRFWRVAVPVALGILVATFFGANYFLTTTAAQIEAHSNVSLSGTNSQQIQVLAASSTAFNQEVALVAAAEGKIAPSSIMLSGVASAAAQAQVTLNQISFQSFSTPVTLSGSATQDRIQAFQTALAAIPGVSNVNLPLANLQAQGGGTETFSLTFVFTPSPNMRP